MRTAACLAAILLGLGGCRTRPAPPVAMPASVDTGTIASGYDLIYALSHVKPQPAPSPFLVAMAGDGRGGAALDIGSGAGRNSLYLAAHGYRVTAVDVSHVGLDLTEQQARLRHLPVTTVAADINRFAIGTNRWDLIALIDFPFAYQSLLPRLAAGLKPGGLVVIQAVSTREPGPRQSPDGMFRYTYMDRAKLDAAFSGFHVLHERESEEPTTWGVKAVMLRFAARKVR